MTREADLFADATLDDVVQRWLHERDFNPARDVDECARLAQLQACQTLRQQVNPSLWTLIRLRGRCAEEEIVRRMCRRGYGVRNQLWVQSHPRAQRRILDISPLPGAARRLRHGIESKYVFAPGYLRRGASGMSLLGSRVMGHIRQVRDQMRRSATPTAVAGLPRQIRIWYSIGGTQSQAEYRQISNVIRGAVRASNARASRAGQIVAQFRRVSF